MKWRFNVPQSEIRKHFHKNWKNLIFYLILRFMVISVLSLILPFRNHFAENYVWLELGKAEEFLESKK